MKETISYVVPCYNSSKTLENVVDEIESTMKRMIDYNYEIVLVNDDSKDKTFEVIEKLCANNSKILGINLSKNFWQHAAFMARFRNLNGDIVVCIDDDGQTPSDEVYKHINKIKEDYDMCYASYTHKEHYWFRRFGSKMNDLMIRNVLNKPKDLKVTSYFAAKRFIIDEIIKYEHSYPYVIGLVLRTIKNNSNVDVTHRKREVGASNYSLLKLLSLWMNGFAFFLSSHLGLQLMWV